MAPNRDVDQEAAARMRSLLTRWQQSLEMHARYLPLDDAHYWHVQPWPAHERPAAWIVQLARQKIAELARALEERLKHGDTAFATGLEHMVFLANLVGLQPAGRYIPLADPDTEQRELLAPEAARAGRTPAAAALDATREMPRPRLLRAPRPNRTVGRAIGTAPAPAGATPTSSAAPGTPAPGPASKPRAPDPATRTVIEDAVRLLQWGRQWHELGELIARLADRPAVGEVRRVLRAHRQHIEATAAVAAK